MQLAKINNTIHNLPTGLRRTFHMRFTNSALTFTAIAVLFAAIPVHAATCSYSFTAGKAGYFQGGDYMQYCITANGTFANFQSPATTEMINQDGAYEGYGICELGGNYSYYDYGDEGNSGNWSAPTLVKQTTSEVVISRSTADGRWTLVQTITEVPGPPPYAKVTMTLENGTGYVTEVVLIRYARFVPSDAGGSGNYKENYDSTVGSTFGYTGEWTGNGGNAFGLMLQNVGFPSPNSSDDFWLAWVANTWTGPAPCGEPNVSSTIINGIGSGFLSYHVVVHRSATVTARYMSF